MPVRSYVGFVADFPTEPEGDTPPGQELATFVFASLKKSGFTIEEPTERSGWAWEFSTQENDLIILSIIALVDDMESNPQRQWLITNDCELGWIKRLFGGKSFQEKRERFLRKFCECLHRVLSTDPRFSQIHWHEKSTFDTPEDRPGGAP